jgi:hypothetical protein
MTDKLVIHPSLEYEIRRVAEAQKQLDFTNAVVWACDNEYGPKFIDDNIWSYGAGMEFRELTREQFNFVKSAISRAIGTKLNELKKESNESQLKLTNTTSIGTISETDDTNVAVWISFKWGIPDTCEVVTSTETKLVVDNENYFVDDMDGKLYHTKTIKKVECSKPLLEAVFLEQQQA